jgi:hypothetical protein
MMGDACWLKEEDKVPFKMLIAVCSTLTCCLFALFSSPATSSSSQFSL